MSLSVWVSEKTVVDSLISIHKPYGIPSTALVEMYKRFTGQKVGHGGTLDPLAEGTMLLGIGKGTKLLTTFLHSEKKYRTRILLGAQSPSGDLELPILADEHIVDVSESRITEVIQELHKGFMQEVPALSAIKQGGKSSYQLVREGKSVEKKFVKTLLLNSKILKLQYLSSSELQSYLEKTIDAIKTSFMRFHQIAEELGYRAGKYDMMMEKWCNSIELSIENLQHKTQHNFVVLEIEVQVPKGTYIRSLATDIATRLGTQGLLLNLERLEAGATL